jgi:hypothetical protein
MGAPVVLTSARVMTAMRSCGSGLGRLADPQSSPTYDRRGRRAADCWPAEHVVADEISEPAAVTAHVRGGHRPSALVGCGDPVRSYDERGPNRLGAIYEPAIRSDPGLPTSGRGEGTNGSRSPMTLSCQATNC